MLSCTPAPSSAGAAAASSPLQFTGYVVGEAGLLRNNERARLTDMLARFEAETQHQMAVVTVRSLGGIEIGRFTRDLANRWGVGRKGHDDGIVIPVAPAERTARIAVGRGLKTRLTERFCRTVMSRTMVPRFRAGGFASGIEAGVASIITRLQAPSG